MSHVPCHVALCGHPVLCCRGEDVQLRPDRPKSPKNLLPGSSLQKLPVSALIHLLTGTHCLVKKTQKTSLANGQNRRKYLFHHGKSLCRVGDGPSGGRGAGGSGFQ